jgi:hypothetical protein
MKFSMRISPQSLQKIILETCAAIMKGLNKSFKSVYIYYKTGFIHQSISNQNKIKNV